MYEQISSNKWKSMLMMFFFFVFVLGIGYIIGRAWGGSDGWYFGIIFAFIFALIMGLVSYYRSDSIALRISGAREVGDGEYPRYRHTVEGLAIAAGVPKPRAYIIDSPAPNAFATGRNPEHSAIAVTTGLLEMLNDQELEGVVAHEMSHIKNYDILIMCLTAVLVGTLILLSDILLRTFWFGDDDSGGGAWIMLVAIVLAILSPIIAQLIKLSIGRKREFLADANGALLTRYPPGLASALWKLQQDPRQFKRANKGTAHMFIVQPLKTEKGARGGWFNRLFDTHPPIEERINRLNQMSGDFVPTQVGETPTVE